MHTRSGFIAALTLLAAGPALARQDTTPGLDAPMRQVFASPAVVGYMTAPTPKDGGLTGVWTWMFLKDAIPTGADTLALEWEFDCTAHTGRMVRQATYRGDAHMTTAPGAAALSAPAAGTPAAIVMASACAAGRGRTQPVANAAAARTAAMATLAAPPAAH